MKAKKIEITTNVLSVRGNSVEDPKVRHNRAQRKQGLKANAPPWVNESHKTLPSTDGSSPCLLRVSNTSFSTQERFGFDNVGM
jgi:hypothetical protein